MKRITGRPTRLAAVAALVSLLPVLLSTQAVSAQKAGFVTGVLPPPPPGSTTPFNQAAEPQIRSDPAGAFYISSENGLGSGTDAWKSVNNGLSYSSLAQPNGISSANASQATGLAPGGGDTDLASAPVKNALGGFNVYVASLTLGSVTISASQNGGQTWQSNELGATVPVDDREWIAATGANTFYASYHNIPTGDQIIVNQGQLVGGVPTSVATYSAINPNQPSIFAATTFGNELGNIAVDQRTGNVYQVFVGCPPTINGVINCPALNTAYMAVGTPTGVNAAGLPVLSFIDYVIFQAAPTTSLNNQFPNVAVDTAGNVYAAWSNDQNVFVSFSKTQGKTWSKPKQVNSGTAVTAIFPWMAAGAPGKVDIVYYGTPAAGNFQDCTVSSGKFNCQNEPWSVFFAQNLNVLGGGGWSQTQASGVVHFGGVCQGGIGCLSNGNDNRDLFDDFGVAASPTTGLASITYSDDQFSDLVGTANAGECTLAQTNSIFCDHTDFATQTSGSGIF